MAEPSGNHRESYIGDASTDIPRRSCARQITGSALSRVLRDQSRDIAPECKLQDPQCSGRGSDAPGRPKGGRKFAGKCPRGETSRQRRRRRLQRPGLGRIFMLRGDLVEAKDACRLAARVRAELMDGRGAGGGGGWVGSGKLAGHGVEEEVEHVQAGGRCVINSGWGAGHGHASRAARSCLRPPAVASVPPGSPSRPITAADSAHRPGQGQWERAAAWWVASSSVAAAPFSLWRCLPLTHALSGD